MAVELPSRFTQAWIRRTMPTLSLGDAACVVAAMRAKGWSDEWMETRVYPYLPEGPTSAAEVEATSSRLKVQRHSDDQPAATSPQPSAASPKVAATITLPCPRGHRSEFPVQPGFVSLRCPACGEEFGALASVRCRSYRHRASGGVTGFTVNERPRYTAWEITYVNPEGDPPEQVLHHTFAAGFSKAPLRAGQFFSVIYRRRGLVRKRLQPVLLVVHTTGDVIRLPR